MCLKAASSARDWPIRRDLVSRLALAGSMLLPGGAGADSGIAAIFDGFPRVKELDKDFECSVEGGEKEG